MHKRFTNQSLQIFRRLLPRFNEWSLLFTPKPRNFNVFATDNPRNKYLLNSSVYRADQLWQTFPSEIKDYASLQLIKDKIKNWSCDRCQCQICSTYIANIGYF